MRRQQRKKQSNGGEKEKLSQLLTVCFRERERKLQARTAALQTSTEELGRKIQLKVPLPPSLPPLANVVVIVTIDSSTKMMAMT